MTPIPEEVAQRRDTTQAAFAAYVSAYPDLPEGAPAFGGNPERKAAAVALALAHAEADALIQGGYWSIDTRGQAPFSGCSIGCLTHEWERPHKRMEALYGIPAEVARIADELFENLQGEDVVHFHVDWIEAIPVGADLWTLNVDDLNRTGDLSSVEAAAHFIEELDAARLHADLKAKP